MDIVTLTMNPTIDLTSSVDKVVPEDKLRCERPNHEPGGGGITVTRAIKKLGGDSFALVASGGREGSQLEDFLEEENIKFKAVRLKNSTRENINIFDQSTTKQFRFVMPGPQVSEEEYNKVLEEIKNIDPKPKFLVASGSLPPGVPDSFYADVAAIGAKMGSKVIIDTSGEALCRVIKTGVYLIKPNWRELNDIAGRKLKDESEVITVSKNLIREDLCEVVLVSLGQGGALLVTKDKTKHLRSPSVEIQSKVGAGDSMVGGLVLKLSQGEDIETAAKYGVAAGAAAVMTPGIELCRKDDTERIFSQM